MRDDIRKTDADSKITSFHIKEEDTQDQEMDRFMRESLIREADELEEKLNRKPELAGIEAPEGLFDAIVGELKERGVWEEEAADRSEAAQATDKTGETKAETEQTVRKAEESEIGQGTDKEERTEAGSDMGAVYAQLPEEDQKALALGRELVRKQEVKTRKRHRRKKVLKISVIVAACLGVIFGVSMTSDANRRLVKRMWDGLMMDFGFKISTNYAGDEESVRSKSPEEIDAMKEIEKKTGAPIIYFEYLPEGMEYQGYETPGGFESVIFYSYQDTVFSITMIDVNKEGSYYYTYDDSDVASCGSVVNEAGVEAKIWEVNLNIDEKTYIAELEYEGWRYMLNGMVSLEEMQNIVQYSLLF